MSVGRFLQQAAAGAGADTGDDDFANVVLLLDGDGTSGDNNETFTDSSTNGFTVTETGSVVQGSFSPYGDHWSNYFDGSGDYLGSSSSSDFAFGTGDFTIEFWFYAVSIPSATNILDMRNGSSGLVINFPNGVLGFYSEPASSYLKQTSTLNANEWYHVAAVRNGTDFDLYINGTAIGSSATDSSNFSASTTVTIGARWTRDQQYFPGYISNVRLVKGTAVYTANFTVPTSPLTAVTNTKLLTCASNNFSDGSLGNHSLTPSGNTLVTPFSPFKNDDARDITTDGGSANFDSSEYLTIADNASLDVSGAMTAEIWVYFTDMPDANIGSSGSGYLFNRWTASGSQRSWGIFVGANGAVSLYVSNSGSSSYITSNAAAGSVGLYRWHHVAVSWDGSNQRLFIDGDLKVTTANTSGPFSTSSAGVTVNSLNVSVTGTNMNAYYSDARYFASAAIYTSSFTPPTAPIGASAGSAYSLRAASYESKSFNILAQGSQVKGVEISTDGTKAYTIEQATDAVYEYDLSTAFDISTASYNSVSFSVASQEITPREVRFKSDGTRMFIVGATGDTVYQYDLSTAWDVSSASYNSVSFSVSSEEANPNGMCFSADGTYMYIAGQSGDDINQYSLTSAWDVSTASFDNKTLDISSEETTPESLAISSDGTQMFMLGQATDKVHQYTLSTAYDISTGSLTTSITPESTNPQGIAFKPDGTKFYIVGPVDDEIKQYSVFSDATVYLNFQDAGIYDRSGINNLDTVGNARLGFAPIYGTGSLAFDGTGDYLSIPDDDTFNFGSGDWTVECWFSRSGGGTKVSQVVFNQSVTGASSDSAVYLGAGNNGLSLYLSTSGTSWTDYIETSTAPSLNTWSHCVWQRRGNTLEIYLDGVLQTVSAGSSSFSGTIFNSSRDIEIGSQSASSYLTGYLDDLRVTKGVARYTSAFTPPDEIDLSTDTHAEYVTFFLDGDGTVNGQNNTFTDSSTNGFTVTESGSVAQGVFSPYGDNWSNYFDGTDYLYGTVNALGTGDFTLECWVNFSSLGANRTIMSFGAFSPALYYRHASTELAVYHGGAFYLSGFTPEVGEWYHVAFTRSGTTSRMFVNGTQQGSDTTYSTNITDTTLRIGYDNVDYTDAYISNVRVVKGTALYTSNFTAPTSPLSAVTNTEILTCQSNRFVDNGSNSITVSVNSTPQVTRFSPFESNKPYDITTDGGSGYFDLDSTAYLSFSGGPSTVSDMTISGWVHPKTMAPQPTNAYPRVFSALPFLIYVRDDDIRIYNNAEKVQAPINNNEWTYFAAQRISNTWTLYINGVSKGTASDSTNIDLNSTNYIGSQGASNYFTGYIADLRITTSGSTSTAVPTSPVSAVTDTELLLNFQDSAIPDLSGLNNIDTVGNAKVDGTDPTKYGSNAMQFDGSGDYLTFDHSLSELSFGTGDFTIEGWFYIQSGDEYPYAFDFRSSASQAAPALYFYNYGNGSIDYYVSGSSRILGTSAGNDVWQHIAVCRSGTSTKMFVNGTQSGSTYTDSTNYAAYSGNIGIKYDNVRPFKGFIDDFRITKGVARYTANFTPPSEALPKF